MKRAINHDHYKYYDFLENLRKSGETNMWGASPYLTMAFFELTDKEATEILLTWMNNYEELLELRGWER